MGIGNELKVAPLKVLDGVKKLPKMQDLADLQARVDCLLNENRELRTQVAEGEAPCKEIEELKDQDKATKEELKRAQEDWDKAVAMAQKFHAFMKNIRATSSTRLDCMMKAQANQGRCLGPRSSGVWWTTAPRLKSC